MTDQSENQEQGPDGRRPRRLWRWIAILLGGPVVIVTAAIALFVTLGIPIDLSFLRDRIGAAAEAALGRDLAIEGAIRVTPTWPPLLEVEAVRIGNPADWPAGEFARLASVRVRPLIGNLLDGDIQIAELTADGLRVNLEVGPEGTPNWTFAGSPDDAAPQEEDDGPGMTFQFVELRELLFTDIAVSYRDDADGTDRTLVFDRIEGFAEADQPIKFLLAGTFEEVPISLEVRAGNVAALFAKDKPWNVDVVLTALDSSLAVKGNILLPLEFRGVTLDFAFEGKNFETIAEKLGTRAPPVASFAMVGRITESKDVIRLSDVEGTLERAAFIANATVDLSGDRPILDIDVDFPRIDASIVSHVTDALEQGDELQPAGSDDATRGADDPEIDFDKPVLILDPLDLFDGDFSISIKEVRNSPLSVTSARFDLSVRDGQAFGPMEAVVAGVKLEGELRLAEEDGVPAASVGLAARDVQDAGLLTLLTGVETIEGSFGNARIDLEARGDTLRSLVNTAALRFAIAGGFLSYGNEAGGRSVEFTLETLQVVLPASGRSDIIAVGTLLKEPFDLEVHGGSFVDYYFDGKFPVELVAQGGGGVFRADGVVQGRFAGPGTNLSFSLAGKSLGDLSRWTGLSTTTDMPYSLGGDVTIAEDGFRLQLKPGNLGETTISGALGIRSENGEPVEFLDLALGTIDVPHKRQTARRTAAPAPDQIPDNSQRIDIPILPTELVLQDTDLNVTIEQVMLANFGITEISLSSAIRDGYVARAPLSAKIEGKLIDGTAAIDLRSDVPAFDLDLQMKDFDGGSFLSRFDIVEGLELTAGTLDLEFDVRGASPRAILQQSSFSAGLTDGLWKLRDANTGEALEIGIPKGTITAQVGKPIALVLDGRIKETPIAIGIETDSLASFADPKESLSAKLTASILDAKLSLSGTTPLPVSARNQSIKLEVSGEKIDAFDALLEVSLPPWGPYGFSGEFGSRASGYYVENVRFTVGGSELVGGVELDTTQKPPRFVADFDARRIQLDDFEFGDWSPTEGDTVQEEVVATPVTTASAADTAENVRVLLSPEVMRSLDGIFTLDVEEVVSGEDKLGSGALKTTIQDGRLSIDPVSVAVPGGSVDLGLAFEPTENGVALDARVRVEQFDYGVLARRIDPAEMTAGRINIDVDLKTRGPTFAEVMAEANGHIDFAVWPQDLKAGVFDLWAVNLFTSMLPSLDSEASTVNCLVARFVVEDGIATPTAILADTSRIQASADGVIDFKTNTVNITAVPQPKTAQFFSAAPSISVAGHFSDFQVGLSEGALVDSSFRIITSPLMVPFSWIFTTSAPADGKIACAKAWEIAPPAEGNKAPG